MQVVGRIRDQPQTCSGERQCLRAIRVKQTVFNQLVLLSEPVVSSIRFGCVDRHVADGGIKGVSGIIAGLQEVQYPLRSEPPWRSGTCYPR